MIVEYIIWWGIGSLLLYIAYLSRSYKIVEPKTFVMSEKMIDIYRNKKGFGDEKILKAVRLQSAYLYLAGGTLIFIGVFRYTFTNFMQ